VLAASIEQEALSMLAQIFTVALTNNPLKNIGGMLFCAPDDASILDLGVAGCRLNFFAC
jgi:hypothetical protein